MDKDWGKRELGKKGKGKEEKKGKPEYTIRVTRYSKSSDSNDIKDNYESDDYKINDNQDDDNK